MVGWKSQHSVCIICVSLSTNNVIILQHSACLFWLLSSYNTVPVCLVKIPHHTGCMVCEHLSLYTVYLWTSSNILAVWFVNISWHTDYDLLTSLSILPEHTVNICWCTVYKISQNLMYCLCVLWMSNNLTSFMICEQLWMYFVYLCTSCNILTVFCEHLSVHWIYGIITYLIISLIILSESFF